MWHFYSISRGSVMSPWVLASKSWTLTLPGASSTFCAASGPGVMLMAVRFFSLRSTSPCFSLPALKRKEGVGKAEGICCEILAKQRSYKTQLRNCPSICEGCWIMIQDKDTVRFPTPAVIYNFYKCGADPHLSISMCITYL